MDSEHEMLFVDGSLSGQGIAYCVQCVLIYVHSFCFNQSPRTGSIPMFIHLTKLPVIMPNKRSLIESEEKFCITFKCSVLAELVYELSN
jgi:hypothetical protein